MNILLCNDDGYQAPGLKVLWEVAKEYGDTRVIAPDRNKSAASHSLTVHRPMVVKKGDNGFYYVNGTPTDCVHLAGVVFKDFKPDFVFSGINDGVNMGEDVLFSGTVGCATQGYLLGISSVAFSLRMQEGKKAPWDTVRIALKDLIEKIIRLHIIRPILWNVNLPSVQPENLKGVRVVSLGSRKADQKPFVQVNPYGETVYWMGPMGRPKKSDHDTDFSLNAQGYVTVTPLTTDRTDYQRLGVAKEALASIEADEKI
ncbi:MAG: 5'/3'-nucleotidase SurE [Haemophilus parainfluenzae]|jgi:5'/3'-nucleotidase surE|nr:MAG: 5'/3'-nucleotidase SurE [Haemophilus parainfluenzae]